MYHSCRNVHFTIRNCSFRIGVHRHGLVYDIISSSQSSLFNRIGNYLWKKHQADVESSVDCYSHVFGWNMVVFWYKGGLVPDICRNLPCFGLDRNVCKQICKESLNMGMWNHLYFWQSGLNDFQSASLMTGITDMRMSRSVALLKIHKMRLPISHFF